MLAEHLKGKQIILASRSPRRQQLLKDLGLDFTIESFDIEENVPKYLQEEEIPVFLATAKVAPFKDRDLSNTIVIGCDTVVLLDETILNKPEDAEEATGMLMALSGKRHKVISGVCILHGDGMESFYDTTKVYFKTLTEDEIAYYVNTYKPFDKAGAYGIQEWLGSIGIRKIKGDYYNVMGLPVRKVFEALMKL